MKKIFILIILGLIISSALFAQQVPQGMKYQAVARNLKGEILANEQILLRISLTGDHKNSSVVYYNEIHNVRTNELGLFTLVIGEGVSSKASFKEIPWSTENIWMEVSIDDKDKGSFTVISSSKLLAVPYAFHAATANRLVDGKTNRDIIAKPPPEGEGGDGTDAQVWQLFGNMGTDPAIDKLGTTDAADVRIVTNNIERMRVSSNGNVSMVNDLTVGKATNLNDVLNVNNMKATYLSGSLTADKLIRFTDGTQSSSSVSGALVVTGGVGIGKNLNVGGDLNVTGLATLKNIAVDGVTGKSLNISDDNSGYLATFTNTNNADGDGIKIKLGKVHPTWDGTSYKHITNSLPESFDPTIAKVNEYIDGTDSWSVDDLVDLIPTVVLAGSIIKLTNLLIPKINEGLGLNPDGKVLLPQTTLYGGGSPVVDALTYVNGGPPSGGVCGSTGDCIIPDGWITPGDPSYAGNGTNIPPLVIPEIKIPKIPLIPEDGLPTFSPFNLSFVSVANSLTKQNEFLIFTDKDDRPLGRIRAQSLSNWRSDYLNTLYFMNLASTFVKTDILSAVVDGITGFSNLINAYNSVGVEYTSGNGDYAEWLERIDPKEIIGTGDIVAVKGGKITKDLDDAEQIMAVSHSPIVLGNVPDKERDYLGNNIAFIGQIPVKVIGPVKAGDYIVAKSDMPGYGVAVDPQNMRVEDFKLAVGRSWATDENKGPKMVNTVVGVHNNDFLDLIKELKVKTDENDTRLKVIETKLNISPAPKISPQKKAFK